jgi:hypothetical protein
MTRMVKRPERAPRAYGGAGSLGLARPSSQPESEERPALPAAWFEHLGRRVGVLLPMVVSP